MRYEDDYSRYYNSGGGIRGNNDNNNSDSNNNNNENYHDQINIYSLLTKYKTKRHECTMKDFMIYYLKSLLKDKYKDNSLVNIQVTSLINKLNSVKDQLQDLLLENKSNKIYKPKHIREKEYLIESFNDDNSDIISHESYDIISSSSSIHRSRSTSLISDIFDQPLIQLKKKITQLEELIQSRNRLIHQFQLKNCEMQQHVLKIEKDLKLKENIIISLKNQYKRIFSSITPSNSRKTSLISSRTPSNSRKNSLINSRTPSTSRRTSLINTISNSSNVSFFDNKFEDLNDDDDDKETVIINEDYEDEKYIIYDKINIINKVNEKRNNLYELRISLLQQDIDKLEKQNKKYENIIHFIIILMIIIIYFLI